MKSKKGIGLEWYMLIVAFFLGFMFYYLYLIGNKQTVQNYIGEYQFHILNAANEGENMIIYAQQSAKYSMQQAIYDLANDGGVEEIENEYETVYEHQCGTFNGAYVWFQVQKTDSGYEAKPCLDNSSTSDNLLYLFNQNMNGHLQNSPNEFPLDNYDYQIMNNLEILGKGINPLKFDIVAKKKIQIESFTGAQDEEPIGKSEPKTTKPGVPVSYKYSLPYNERAQDTAVDRIILHHTGDSRAYQTYNTLKQRDLSVHYIVDRDGMIYYAVDESKRAWHAGNWNSRSIGIEIVNTGYRDMQYTDEQYASIKSLINDMASRWPSIKVDDAHVIGHYQATAEGKWDPSPNFDWARIGLPNHPTLQALGKNAPSEYGWA